MDRHVIAILSITYSNNYTKLITESFVSDDLILYLQFIEKDYFSSLLSVARINMTQESEIVLSYSIHNNTWQQKNPITPKVSTKLIGKSIP